jgi:nitrate reductase / nitrite oxidoreductase, beta subunit
MMSFKKSLLSRFGLWLLPCANAIALEALAEAGLSLPHAEAIYKLTTQPDLEERFVLPPYHREMSVETHLDPLRHKGQAGLGYVDAPSRGA